MNYVAQFNTAIPPCRTLYNKPKYTMTGTDRQTSRHVVALAVRTMLPHTALFYPKGGGTGFP